MMLGRVAVLALLLATASALVAVKTVKKVKPSVRPTAGQVGIEAFKMAQQKGVELTDYLRQQQAQMAQKVQEQQKAFGTEVANKQAAQKWKSDKLVETANNIKKELKKNKIAAVKTVAVAHQGAGPDASREEKKLAETKVMQKLQDHKVANQIAKAQEWAASQESFNRDMYKIAEENHNFRDPLVERKRQQDLVKTGHLGAAHVAKAADMSKAMAAKAAWGVGKNVMDKRMADEQAILDKRYKANMILGKKHADAHIPVVQKEIEFQRPESMLKRQVESVQKVVQEWTPELGAVHPSLDPYKPVGDMFKLGKSKKATKKQ